LVEARKDIGDGPEAAIENVGFARVYLRVLDIAQMDHAQVDATDRGFIVVD
jgi:hypothetical protein